MGYWLDVYLCGLVVLGKVIGAVGLALLIQLISYQVFGINLYQRICKGFDRLEKYLDEKFVC